MDSLSVVIPCFREATRLPESLARLPRELEAAGCPASEIVVVDDGSDDTTSDVVRAAAAKEPLTRLIRLIRFDRNRGKGHAVREGVLAATGDWILVTDADLSTPPADVVPLLAAGRAGHPVVIGSRRLADSRIEVRQPIHRRILGSVFAWLRRLLVLPGISDTQCGFKLFHADAAKAIFAECREDGFVYDVEVLWLARKKGYAISEVPVRWADDPRTQVSALPASLSMFIGLIRLAVRRISG